MRSYKKTRMNVNTKNIVRIAMLAAVAVGLMFFKVPAVFMAPGFMKLDISDVPVLIAGFAMGPISGVIVSLLKNLLNMLIEGSATGGIGELTNFIIGSSFVLASSIIYRKSKTIHRAILSLVVGILFMTLLASLSNYYIIFPLYGKVMIPIEKIIEMGSAISSRVVDLKTMIIYTVVPFNLLKGTVNALVTFLLYKRISPLLKD